MVSDLVLQSLSGPGSAHPHRDVLLITICPAVTRPVLFAIHLCLLHRDSEAIGGHHRQLCGSAERTQHIHRQLLQAPISLCLRTIPPLFSTRLIHPYDVSGPLGGQHFERPHERCRSPGQAYVIL